MKQTNNMNTKRKINIADVCKAYNTAREQNTGKKGDSKWVIQILKSFGISNHMATKMISQPTLFQQFRREGTGKGNYKGYIWPYTPVHITWFQNWIYPSKKNNTSQSFEEECAEYLRKQGYKLRRRVGFDEEKLKEDYPQLYEKYVIYEEV